MPRLIRILLAVYLFSICRPLSAADEGDRESEILACYTEICKPQKSTKPNHGEMMGRVRLQAYAAGDSGAMSELEALFNQFQDLNAQGASLLKTRLLKLSTQIDRLTPMQRRFYQILFSLDNLGRELGTRMTSVRQPVKNLDWLDGHRHWDFTEDFGKEDWRKGVSAVIPLSQFNFESPDLHAWYKPWSLLSDLGEEFISEMLPYADNELKKIEETLGKDFSLSGMSAAKAHERLEMARKSEWKDRRDILDILSAFSFIHFSYLAITLPELEALDREPLALDLKRLESATMERREFSSFEAELMSIALVASFSSKSRGIEAQSRVFRAVRAAIEKNFSPAEQSVLIPAIGLLKYQGPLSVEDVVMMASHELKAKIAKKITENANLVRSSLGWSDLEHLVKIDKRIKSRPLRLTDSSHLLAGVQSIYTPHVSAFYHPEFGFIDMGAPRFSDSVDPFALAHEFGHFVKRKLDKDAARASTLNRMNLDILAFSKRLYPSVKEEKFFFETKEEDFADAFAGLVGRELEPRSDVSESFLCRKATNSYTGEISVDDLQSGGYRYAHYFFRILNVIRTSGETTPNSCSSVTWDRVLRMRN